MAITVCHYPPGTSKWNKIEHRLFSFISLNWKGKPLVNFGELRKRAKDTLALTGLDRKISVVIDDNGKQVAIDRVSQRMEVWAIAEVARDEVTQNPGNNALRRMAVLAAQGHGFFSIWITVFSGDPDMRNRLIDAFAGTRGSGCFDPTTTLPVSPAPNFDGLPHGSKV
jgi:hypothetical protein